MKKNHAAKLPPAERPHLWGRRPAKGELERIDTKILSFSEKNPKRRRQVKIDFRKMFTSAFHFVKR